MKGLRTQEGKAFEKFFAIIQEKAENENKVFFAEGEEGNDAFFPDMECCDMWGWLIPNDDSLKDFEECWLRYDDDALDKWSDNFVLAKWKQNENNEINIEFIKYESYEIN